MLPDPRRFPDPRRAPPDFAAAYEAARLSLGAATRAESDARDESVDTLLRSRLRAEDGETLARLMAGAPGVDIYRHLVRRLAVVAAESPEGDAAVATLFAIPLAIVTAGTADQPAGLDAVLTDTEGIAAALREHGALGGNRTFGIANTLAGAHALDVVALPRLLARSRLRHDEDFGPLEISPSAIRVEPGVERVVLRFLVGRAISAPGVALFREQSVGRWGILLAQRIAAQISTPAVTMLALPRPAQPVVMALQAGRLAQRETSVHVFASNAIRRLRSNFGEPAAVISAHRVGDGSGEIRLSLSTPCESREAEGFRCPLYPFDRVADVATSLVDLMRDCRIADIRVVDGVHGDRDPLTGGTLMFKPDAVPASTTVRLQ